MPDAYAVTALPVAQLMTQLLPYVGAPNRTALDQPRLDDVAAALLDLDAWNPPTPPPLPDQGSATLAPGF